MPVEGKVGVKCDTPLKICTEQKVHAHILPKKIDFLMWNQVARHAREYYLSGTEKDVPRHSSSSAIRSGSLKEADAKGRQGTVL